MTASRWPTLVELQPESGMFSPMLGRLGRQSAPSVSGLTPGRPVASLNKQTVIRTVIRPRHLKESERGLVLRRRGSAGVENEGLERRNCWEWGGSASDRRARRRESQCERGICRAMWGGTEDYLESSEASTREASASTPSGPLRWGDVRHMLRAAELAETSAGITAPHPNSGCVIVRAKDGGRADGGGGGEGKGGGGGSVVVGEGYLYGQGTTSAEVQAAAAAGELARGGTAYLNLEPGDCHGDDAAVRALVQAGVGRVVVGLLHPLAHARGQGVGALRAAGVRVDVVAAEGGWGGDEDEEEGVQAVLRACEAVNTPLLYRAAYKVPFSVLKYAMTIDGKIAASTGHAAWVSSKQARAKVFDVRAKSDAVIVGGNTVRRDNPRLTTRREGGHLPLRVVMSRTLRLPEDASLWDTAAAPTVVMTQRGAREDFQARLAKKGVEVVAFDFLTPKGVTEYLYQRGCLQLLWECGGTLAAPAITSNTIHKVMAFVAPKIIGGVSAPSPVGDLGFVEMTQAVQLTGVSFEQVGPDMMIQGFTQPLPNRHLAAMEPPPEAHSVAPAVASSVQGLPSSSAPPAGASQASAPPQLRGEGVAGMGGAAGVAVAAAPARAAPSASGLLRVIQFYKAWDAFGALGNFSPHPVEMPDAHGGAYVWRSVEHFYQAQKFKGVEDPLVEEVMETLLSAESPEEAARVARRLAAARPDLVRPDWESVKVPVMYSALVKKFATHSHLADLLMSTGDAMLVEASPHDYFWGAGCHGNGANHLGRLLMRLRAELRAGGSSTLSS